MDTRSIPEIFVSYAWEKESEAVIQKLESECAKQNIKVVRDKTDIGFKGLISEYMKRLGKGKYVVIILSEKYLKSQNCMFEMLEISKNGSFYERIFPIVLDSANFYKPTGRIKYISYWEKEIAEINEALKSLESQADLAGVRDDLDLLTRIRASFGELTNIIRDMNCLSLEQHMSGNFEDLLSSIKSDLSDTSSVEGTSIVDSTGDQPETVVSDLPDVSPRNSVYPNLLKIVISPKLYIANLNIDRDTIIQGSWEGDFKLKKSASDTKVISYVLRKEEAKVDFEWHAYNKQVISFQNLNEVDSSFKNLLDVTSIEEYDCIEFCSMAVANLNFFKILLMRAIIVKLRNKNIEWRKDEWLFRFKMDLVPKVKKLKWKDKIAATRTVIFEKWNKDQTQIVAFRHLAFKANIYNFNNVWYLAVNPTWSMTVDGHHPYKYGFNDVSGIKKLETNRSVLNHFRFLKYCLLNSQENEIEYRTITFESVN